MQMIDRQGAVHEIPEEKVQEAFQTGQYGFTKGTSLPISTATGTLGRIDAKYAAQAFAEQSRLLMPEEVKHAEREEKYGSGLGNAAAAAGEGYARGLTLDQSDTAAIALARMLHGEQAANDVREHLAGEKEANPWASGLSEAAGMATPFLVPGGAAVEGAELAARGAQGARVVAEGAEGARALAGAAEGGAAVAEGAAGLEASARAAAETNRAAQLGQGIGAATRAAGILPRAVSGVGGLTEKAIASIVGTDASGFVARTAQRIAAKGGAAAVEGALYSEADQIDEAVLGNEELNGEKMVAAATHGALLAGGGVGLLTGGGSLAREVAGRMSPAMEKLAGWQAWKAASPAKKFSEKALKRAGGPAEVGARVVRLGVLENASNVEELLANTDRVAFKEVGPALAEAMGTKANLTLGEVDKIFAEAEEKLQGKALHGNILATVRKARAEVMGALAPEAANTAAKVHMPTELTPEELQKFAQQGVLSNPAKMEAAGLEFTAGMQVRRKATAPTIETVAKATMDTEIPVAKLIEQRRAIQDAVYRGVKTNDASLPVEELRDISRQLGELENDTIDRASRAAGTGPTKEELQKLRRDYQALMLYREALQNSNSKYATNRNLSLTDYMLATGAIASGHPIGAVAALGHKVLRERGNAWAARTIDKMRTLGAIERATSQVDRNVERGLTGFFSRDAGARPTRILPRALAKQGGEGDYEKRVQAVAHATAYADHHADSINRVASAISAHAPNIARNFERSSLAVTSHLAKEVPQGHIPSSAIAPHLEEPRVSEMQKSQFNRTFDMAHDPVGTTFDRLNRGMLTKSDVINLQSMYPALYGDIRQKAITELGSQTKKLTFDKRMQIGLLLDLPAEQAIEPLFIKTMQTTFAPEEKAPANATQATPKRELKKLADTAALSPGLADIE